MTKTNFLKFCFYYLQHSRFLRAEGTPQWMPAGMDAGQELCLVVFNDADGNGRLGTTGCDSLERIYIAVSSVLPQNVSTLG